MSYVIHRVAACSVLALLLAAHPSAWHEGAGAFRQNTPAQNPDAEVLADFQARLKEYAALHEKLEATLSRLPKGAAPEAIDEHQRALERLMARARAGARQGDLFADDIRAYVRRQLHRVFRGPDGPSIRAAIMDEETRAVRPRINGRYPDGIPRSNVPPQILLVLPRLPEQLEYRFVGDRLILLDIHALTVADYMDSAVPR